MLSFVTVFLSLHLNYLTQINCYQHYLYRDQLPDGEKAVVAGWGRTVRRKSAAATDRLIRNKVNVKVLQYLKVPIANGKCGSGAQIEIDNRTQICAGGEKGKQQGMKLILVWTFGAFNNYVDQILPNFDPLPFAHMTKHKPSNDHLPNSDVSELS